MLIKTHLAITLFFVFLFLPLVDNQILFVLVAFIVTFVPDIDSRFSTLGKKKTARILQFFTKHRGMIHSFSFLFLITLIFVFFYPILAFPFFLGYSLHLIADCFTVEGIRPFYPFKKKCKGWFRTGGKREVTLLVFLLVADFGLIVWRIYGLV